MAPLLFLSIQKQKEVRPTLPFGRTSFFNPIRKRRSWSSVAGRAAGCGPNRRDVVPRDEETRARGR